MNNTQLLKEQYRDGTNLDARVALHKRFSTAMLNFHDWLFDHIEVKADAHVLELGCGTGALWDKVHARVPPTWRLTLSDLSLGMMTGTRAKFASLGLSAQFVQSDAQMIPFADETFDAVFANHMLYHMLDLPKALGEIRRVLKDGGKLYAATNSANHMRELREFTDALGLDYSYVTELSFRLENGAELLLPFFASVTRDDFDDALIVTDAEPLVAYILSMRAAMHGVSNQQVQQLHAMASERIARDGAMHITKETGLFVAKKTEDE